MFLCALLIKTTWNFYLRNWLIKQSVSCVFSRFIKGCFTLIEIKIFVTGARLNSILKDWLQVNWAFTSNCKILFVKIRRSGSISWYNNNLELSQVSLYHCMLSWLLASLCSREAGKGWNLFSYLVYSEVVVEETIIVTKSVLYILAYCIYT